MKISTIALIAGASLFAAASAFAGHHEGKENMGMDAKIEAHFAEVDADGDGSVTEAEYLDYKMAKAKEKFAKVAGDDGVISLEEAKAAHTAKMEAHKAKMKERGDHHKKGQESKED